MMRRSESEYGLSLPSRILTKGFMPIFKGGSSTLTSLEWPCYLDEENLACTGMVQSNSSILCSHVRSAMNPLSNCLYIAPFTRMMGCILLRKIIILGVLTGLFHNVV